MARHEEAWARRRRDMALRGQLLDAGCNATCKDGAWAQHVEGAGCVQKGWRAAGMHGDIHMGIDDGGHVMTQIWYMK